MVLRARAAAAGQQSNEKWFTPWTFKTPVFAFKQSSYTSIWYTMHNQYPTEDACGHGV